MAYSEGADWTDVGPSGTCPASHPVVVPQVMFEVMWDVSRISRVCLVGGNALLIMCRRESLTTRSCGQRMGPSLLFGVTAISKSGSFFTCIHENRDADVCTIALDIRSTATTSLDGKTTLCNAP
jgi:hypothetical protein